MRADVRLTSSASVLESLCAVVPLGDTTVELVMHDTPGQEDFDRLRPLSYPGSQVVLILFAKDGPDSLDNIMEKWYSEVIHYLPGVPIVLVGNKKDLEHDPRAIEELRRTSQHPVTYSEVRQLPDRSRPDTETLKGESHN